MPSPLGEGNLIKYKTDLIMKTVFYFLLALLTLPSFSQASNEAQAQIKAVTAYYQRYLNQNYENTWPSIFSKRLVNALESNISDCKKFVRNGNMCGYTANGDLLLNAQDYSPTLTFANSKFVATAKPHNQVIVNFVLFPGDEDEGSREINFTLSKEGNEWKIDDIESSVYESIKSERDALIEMNAPLENAIADLQITLEYLSYEYLSPFMNDKTQICESKKCSTIDNTKLSSIHKKLFDYYFKKTEDNSVEPLHKFVDIDASAKSTAKEQKRVTTGIFTWEFQDQIWMITKIDLDSIK